MATNRNRLLARSLAGANRPNPILSGMQFVQQTNTIPTDGSDQGASLDVKSGRMLTAGKTDTWMVGGHIGNDGKQIAPEHVPGRSINLLQGVNHVQRVLAATRGQGGRVAAGSWFNPRTKQIDLDASTMIADREEAILATKRRNEEATFNLRDFETWKNPDFRPPA